MKTAKEIREMIKEADACGKYVFAHWHTQSFRVIHAKRVKGVDWVKAMDAGYYMVTTAHTFDIR